MEKKTKQLWKSESLWKSKISENLKNFVTRKILKFLEILNTSEPEEFWKSGRFLIWLFLKQFWGLSCRKIEQDLNFKIYKVGPKAKRPKNKKTPTHPMTMPQAAGKNLLWLLDNNTFTRNCNLLPSFHLTGSKNTSSWPIYSGVPNAGVAKKVELTAGSTETEEELARNRYKWFICCNWPWELC